jgi:hypothetical protein
VVKEEGAGCSWLPYKELIGDEGEAQRGLALETAAILAQVVSSEEKLVHSEFMCRSAAQDSLYDHY